MLYLSCYNQTGIFRIAWNLWSCVSIYFLTFQICHTFCKKRLLLQNHTYPFNILTKVVSKFNQPDTEGQKGSTRTIISRWHLKAPPGQRLPQHKIPRNRKTCHYSSTEMSSWRIYNFFLFNFSPRSYSRFVTSHKWEF